MLPVSRLLPRCAGAAPRPAVRATRRHVASQRSLPCTYYRGGTSRALIFARDDLPTDRAQWPVIFRRALGSPDPNGRQLDGMGGGISSLSKICIVGPAQDQAVADVDYEFVAVGVFDGDVDFSANCGNMSAAIGPWAWDNGLIDQATHDGFKTVRIWNVNSSKMIRSTFEVEDGEACMSGDMSMAGVAGTGAPILLDFVDPAGSRTGKLLPTGNVVDTVDEVSVSCIDVALPGVFVNAAELGVDGSILPQAFDENQALRQRLERIRRSAAVKMGIAATEEQVPASLPKICLVSPPADHPLLSGEVVPKRDFDLMVRAVSVGQPHRAVPATLALCLAVAAKLPGTVVHQCVADTPADEKGITLSHPSGKVVVGATFDDDGTVTQASVYRTARKLMEGRVFWVPET